MKIQADHDAKLKEIDEQWNKKMMWFHGEYMNMMKAG